MSIHCKWTTEIACAFWYGTFNTKQCGLRDKEFANKKDLEKHLTLCEIFVSDNSGSKDTFLSDSEEREHIREIHKKMLLSISPGFTGFMTQKLKGK